MRLSACRYTEAHHALEEAAAAAAELAEKATGLSNKGGPFLSAPRSPTVPQELTLLHCTALHLAASFGHTQAVQALLTSPACSPAACNAMVSATGSHFQLWSEDGVVAQIPGNHTGYWSGPSCILLCIDIKTLLALCRA